MNEADTRRELIDPKIKEAGWGEIEGSYIRAEFQISNGEIKPGGIRAGIIKADYVLIYRNRKLAVIEAKKDELPVSDGVGQAKDYAQKLKILTTYSTNGKEIYEINYSKNEKGEMFITSEGLVDKFPSPDELWAKTFKDKNEWSSKFDSINFEPFKGSREPRYYQEIAINNALDAIADKQQKILLTLATGTGKTVIAFHIAWKLFQSRWNIQRDGKRIPRILFLADRNILANQAFNSFSSFDENALVRITPQDVKDKGHVPTNGSVFFTIFQSFMSGPENKPYFGQYPADFFDLVIIDECHRGGAKDESRWRGILEYFSSAVQIGLTATPKRKFNADTYAYFGEPVYTYSLKDGIKDGFLTPFKVKRIQTTMDEYVYTGDDDVLSGEEEINEGEVFEEKDFNKRIVIEEREKKRVQLMLDSINPKEKTLVFCASIAHAGMVRDLINQVSINPPADYCVRVTAKDTKTGDTHLRQFQDNEKTLPTILTTSQKLSTGVDALNIRNIVLMRPVNNMIEFKQIIGRGTRLFEDKFYFTIVDFVGASANFSDPDWDGEPMPEEPPKEKPEKPFDPGDGPGEEEIPPKPPKEKIIIKLAEGKELSIKSMSTSLFYFQGQPVTAEEFIKKLFNTITLPSILKSEDELRKLWSSPITRNELLKKLEDNGFTKQDLKSIQTLIEAEDSDIFDVLEHIAYSKKPIQRSTRVANAESKIYTNLDANQKEFIDFVLSKYVEAGVDELDINRLSDLVVLKYKSLHDGQKVLGDADKIKNTFIDFQKYLY
ncbi:EcoAI/FtnUII family type I restriction enzme subunit R [Candidatus Pelagibacter sp.]|uniref:EcoAI/FtnUII family type I restriction enzme subunit R n=1 Tax=Candidatus Pelagibacter sp. TaxID=2024849 RepID=UPI003F867B2D